MTTVWSLYIYIQRIAAAYIHYINYECCILQSIKVGNLLRKEFAKNSFHKTGSKNKQK